MRKYSLIALNTIFCVAVAQSHPDSLPGWFLVVEGSLVVGLAVFLAYRLAVWPRREALRLDRLERGLRDAMSLPDAEWERERERLMKPWRK